MSAVSEKLQNASSNKIANEIDRYGYSVIENFVGTEDLVVAKDFVKNAVDRNEGNYVGFNGAEGLEGTFLASLGSEPNFVNLCRGIYTSHTKKPAPNVGFYQILRCMSGSSAKEHAMRFHFDSYVLTALIPILIPNSGSPGRLLIHPNTRQLRSLYGTNLLDKFLFDNPASQYYLNRIFFNKNKKLIRLNLVPGNIYFFWGYESLHTNEPCDHGELRSTALFHYGDPHNDSILKRAIRR